MGGRKLLDEELIARVLLAEAPWAESHGANADERHLGAGLLYYALAYALRAELCVCLGSGGGFVPRMMRQAQRDLGLDAARTVLVDGNTGDWKTPVWLPEDSFFRQEFPDVQVSHEKTVPFARSEETRDWRIDFLHIDADHSRAGSFADFEAYRPLMSPRGVITFHDTRPYEYYNITCWKTLDDIRRQGHDVIDLPWIGAGTALIQLRDAPARSGRYTPFHRKYLRNLLWTWRQRLLRAAGRG